MKKKYIKMKKLVKFVNLLESSIMIFKLDSFEDLNYLKMILLSNQVRVLFKAISNNL